MINLLPPQVRQDIMYARRNTKLRNWITATVLGLFGIAIIVVFGEFYLHRSTSTYAHRVADSQQQLKIQKLDETQKRVQDISGSLKLVVQVLGREVLFSELLQQIGAAMPPGSSLSSLNISKIQGGIDLNAVAKDYQIATQVQVNMQDPANQIFQKADILNVSCHSGTGVDPDYPCQVGVRALFNKNNKFLFIHSTAGAKP